MIHRAERLEATREAAVAFLEDVQYLRSMTQRSDLSAAEIRRLSGLLRRLLVDRDLLKISAPRIGRVLLRAPDNNPYYRAERHRPFMFFASGRANVLGGFSGVILAYDVVSHPLAPIWSSKVTVPEVDINKTVDLKLDGFMSQRVLCYRGKWVHRGAVIKYVANVASGVHSGHPKDPDEILLAQMRSSTILSRRGDGVHIELFPHGVDTDTTVFSHRPEALDAVLIELLAAASFFIETPSIAALERFIQDELELRIEN